MVHIRLVYILCRIQLTEMRLAFAGKAFLELGFKGQEQKMRTRMFIGFLSGERIIFGPDKKAAQRYREASLNLLLGTPG